MTVIVPQPYITCDNKEFDCCVLFKKLLIEDSVGNVYLRVWNFGEGGGGNSNAVEDSFTMADCVIETIDAINYLVLKVTHNLDSLAPGLTVIDNNLNQVVGLTQRVVNANTSWIILGSDDEVIDGTWQYSFIA